MSACGPWWAPQKSYGIERGLTSSFGRNKARWQLTHRLPVPRSKTAPFASVTALVLRSEKSPVSCGAWQVKQPISEGYLMTALGSTAPFLTNSMKPSFVWQRWQPSLFEYEAWPMVRWPEVRYWLRAPRSWNFGSEPWQSTQAAGKANFDLDCAAAVCGRRAAASSRVRGSQRVVIMVPPG